MANNRSRSRKTPDVLDAVTIPRAADPPTAAATRPVAPPAAAKTRLAWYIDAELDEQLRAIYDDRLGTDLWGKYSGWSEFGERILRRTVEEVEQRAGGDIGRATTRYPTGPQARRRT